MDQQYATYYHSGSPPQSYDNGSELMKRTLENSPSSHLSSDPKKARWSPPSTHATPFAGNPGLGLIGNNNPYQQQQSSSTQPQQISAAQQLAISQQQIQALQQQQLGLMQAQIQQQQQQGQQSMLSTSPGGSQVTPSSPYMQMGMPMGGGMMNPMMQAAMMGNYGGYPQMMGQQQRPMNPQMPMNPAQMTGNYGPAAAAAAASAAAAGNQTGRTVYVGNLPADASVDELLSLVRFGPIESVRLLPEKSCVFISFLDGSTAAAFHADASVKKLALLGQELKIGWGKPSNVPRDVVAAITANAATRNVYLGGLDEDTTEQGLRDDLSRFGPIDQVKIVRDKNIGFVHFLTIATAIKVVQTLPTEEAWAGKRVNYGKDRCAYVPKAQQAAVQAAQAQAQASIAGAAGFNFSPMGQAFPSFSNSGSQTPQFGGSPFQGFQGMGMDQMGSPMMGGPVGAGGSVSQVGNRTVYLGNVHPETTTEDLCNAIRGGMIAQIRYMPEKHIAFVSFVDAAHAAAFYQNASFSGLTLNSRRLKIGWGKHSGPLHPATVLAIQGGATRNVYVGGIEDFDTFSEERLKKDFQEWGDIELVNFLREKNCAFINFTSIANAQKAKEGIKSKPEYANLKIAYGKDRCANPPRSNSNNNNLRGNSRSGSIPAGSPNPEEIKEEDIEEQSEGLMHITEED